MDKKEVERISAALIAYDTRIANAIGRPSLLDRFEAMQAAFGAARDFQSLDNFFEREAAMCEARQYSDEMKCGRCGLSWDVKDPDPPRCGKTVDRRAIPDRRVTRQVARLDAPPSNPGVSPDVLLTMAGEFKRAEANGATLVDAMRAALEMLR